MTYEVEYELMIRTPEVAAYAGTLALDKPASSTYFIHAQNAVDEARSWVRNFDGSDILAAARPWYGADSLPRARVLAVPARQPNKWAARKPARLIFHAFKNLAGEIVEHQYRKGEDA